MELAGPGTPKPDKSHAGIEKPVADCPSDPADQAPGGGTFGTCRNVPWDKTTGGATRGCSRHGCLEAITNVRMHSPGVRRRGRATFLTPQEAE
jgi:hypothetical protein